MSRCGVVLLAAGACIAAGQQTPASEQDRIVAFHVTRSQARPDDAGALRMLAEALVKRAEVTGEPGDYDRAWETLDRVESLEPGELPTLRARARLLLSRHRFPQALALAAHGLKQYPQDTDLLAVAGDAALEMGDLEAAAAHYGTLHELSSQLHTWARLAHVAELRGRLEEAAVMMEQAMDTGLKKGAPSESLAWSRAVLGELRLKQGRPEEARKQYALGLEKSPEHPLVWEHLAELEKHENRLEAAEAAYRKLLSWRPDPVSRLRLAQVVEDRGDLKAAEVLRAESLRFLERVVAAGNEGFLRPLAEMDLAAGRYDRAAALLARDVSLRPTAEGRALLRDVLAAAAAAGRPVNGLGPVGR
jgi:tetratricopeptide (TPR) repeat protein